MRYRKITGIITHRSICKCSDRFKGKKGTRRGKTQTR